MPLALDNGLLLVLNEFFFNGYLDSLVLSSLVLFSHVMSVICMSMICEA